MTLTDEAAARDLFEYLVPYRLIICRVCRAGIPPTYLVRHIQTYHVTYSPAFKTPRSTTKWVAEVLLPGLPTCPLDPLREAVVYPPIDGPPLPGLAISNGYGCNLCSYVRSTERQLKAHFNATHATRRRGRGGPRPTAAALRDRLLREHYGETPPWHPAAYQRFYNATVKDVRYFRVQLPKRDLTKVGQRLAQKTRRISCSSHIASKVFHQLACVWRSWKGRKSESLCADCSRASVSMARKDPVASISARCRP